MTMQVLRRFAAVSLAALSLAAVAEVAGGHAWAQG
jgi:hypothetical protein